MTKFIQTILLAAALAVGSAGMALSQTTAPSGGTTTAPITRNDTTAPAVRSDTTAPRNEDHNNWGWVGLLGLLGLAGLTGRQRPIPVAHDHTTRTTGTTPGGRI